RLSMLQQSKMPNTTPKENTAMLNRPVLIGVYRNPLVLLLLTILLAACVPLPAQLPVQSSAAGTADATQEPSATVQVSDVDTEGLAAMILETLPLRGDSTNEGFD